MKFSIHDRGRGLDATVVEAINAREPPPMSSADATSLLGLMTASRIAEAIRGKLTVRIHPSQGSIFTLHAPALDAEGAHAVIEAARRRQAA